MSKVAGCSDTTMQDLWRAVVHQEWGGVCALAGTECQGELQCHHIIKRRRPHLKHVPANGILLCAHHHELVENFPSWRERVNAKIGADKLEWLEAEAKKLLPDWLREHGWSRREWLEHQKAYLQGLLDSEGGA